MKVEKGIPMPRPYKERAESARTVATMVPTDSVLVESEAVARNLSRIGKNRGFKMAQRKMEGGWRVWRVE